MSCSFMTCHLVRQFHVRRFHVKHFQRPIHLFCCLDTFAVGCIVLATMHFVTDRRTDDSIMQVADHTACSNTVG